MPKCAPLRFPTYQNIFIRMKVTLLMIGFKVLAYALIGLFFINIANATTIYGTVYDLDLNKVNKAMVEINTSPKQFMVAQNGSYSFNAPNGAYAIKAQLMQKTSVLASVQENITIKQDGSYVLDLILFPDVEEGIEDIGIDVNGNVVETKSNNIAIGFVVLFILIAVYHFIKTKKSKKELKEEIRTGQKEHKSKESGEDYGLNQVIEIIKKEGNRATQKDIRKQIPLSEAKISLMIAELEHKGIIEKIKKGRGNIIILKKK